MNLLAELEQSALSQWLTTSMLGFPTLIALHSVGMAIAVGLSLIVTLRLYGFVDGIGREQLPRLLNVVVWGFTLNLVTGLALFITRATDYITSGVFLTKIGLVAVGAILALGIREQLQRPGAAEAVAKNESAIRSLALISTASWFAAVVAGRLIAYLSDLYQ